MDQEVLIRHCGDLVHEQGCEVLEVKNGFVGWVERLWESNVVEILGHLGQGVPALLSHQAHVSQLRTTDHQPELLEHQEGNFQFLLLAAVEPMFLLSFFSPVELIRGGDIRTTELGWRSKGRPRHRPFDMRGASPSFLKSAGNSKNIGLT